MTPMMQQYRSLKDANPDCLLFFRLGDFYELFFEDALTASKALDITLTKRRNKNGDEAPMCGVPYHSADNYIARLVRQGFRVAICEQSESPEQAKKRGGYKAIVKREIVRIVTPGTLTEDQMLSARCYNYLALICDEKEQTDPDTLSFALVDITTGDFYLETCLRSEIENLVSRVSPAEIVIPERLLQTPELFEIFHEYKKSLTPLPDSRFDVKNSALRLQEYYEVKTLDGFGAFRPAEITAASTLLDYVKLTQRQSLPRLALPKRYGVSELLEIDAATRRNLELIMTTSGSYKGSLLHLVDQTRTACGARHLSQHVASPLKDLSAIKARHDNVSFFIHSTHVLEKIREKLELFPDIERALSRLAMNRGGPRDLNAVRIGLECASEIRSVLEGSHDDLSESLRDYMLGLVPLTNLINRLQRALKDDLPMLARDGDFIRPGYLPELDELITLRDQGKGLILKLQDTYREQTGIASLKIKHNNILGYHIEVTNSHADKIPYGFIHRQTIASALRYTSQDLSELEQELNSAKDRALALEQQLFQDLVKETLALAEDISTSARCIAEIDVAHSHAFSASQMNYARPDMVHEPILDLEEARHPVVEKALLTQSGDSFVPNGCQMELGNPLWLLTGPNMAGKSTFLRQNALIILMAQIGSFVPAKRARIGIVDRLFSRVGASDDLARGRSTFMVEMVETAAILNQATKQSFVILDEVGRGTSTHDGLSLAWAILEHLHNVVRCRTLFATHYHELTTLSETLGRLECRTMKIREWKGRAVFLHEVIEGKADKSYGLYVAKMAGLPEAVLTRADEILKQLESKGVLAQPDSHPQIAEDYIPQPQASYSPENELLLQKYNLLATSLEGLKPDDLTPRQAQEKLYELYELAKENGKNFNLNQKIKFGPLKAKIQNVSKIDQQEQSLFELRLQEASS